MRNRKRWLPLMLVVVLAVVVAAGCTRGAGPADGDPVPPEPPASDGEEQGQEGGQLEPPGTDAGSRQPAPAGAGMDRPETAETAILLEGMEETIPVRLFATPSDWPLQFSTYHPEDWVAEASTGAGGAAVRFTVAYGGRRNDDAYLEVAVYPAGTDEAEARERLAGLAADLGIAEVPEGERRYPWSLAEYAAAGDVVQGLALGRHGGGWFHIRWHYPAEHGDGFGPRQALVLDQWIWADNGLPLDPGK